MPSERFADELSKELDRWIASQHDTACRDGNDGRLAEVIDRIKLEAFVIGLKVGAAALETIRDQAKAGSLLQQKVLDKLDFMRRVWKKEVNRCPNR